MQNLLTDLDLFQITAFLEPFPTQAEKAELPLQLEEASPKAISGDRGLHMHARELAPLLPAAEVFIQPSPAAVFILPAPATSSDPLEDYHKLSVCGMRDPTLVTLTENGGNGRHPACRDIQSGRCVRLLAL
jgi:hypothetical protein